MADRIKCLFFNLESIIQVNVRTLWGDSPMSDLISPADCAFWYGSCSGLTVILTHQFCSLILYSIYGYFPSGVSFAFPSNGIFTGLTNITVTQEAGTFPSAAVATFQIATPATTTVISNYVPADVIVIPASATGSVQIILESSPDLVNWTAAEPGTYGASAGTNRFFRVRAVAN